MTGERIEQRDLVITKLLRNGVHNYKSIFPHVAAAIQLSTQGKTPVRGENIQYIILIQNTRTHFIESFQY